MPYKSIKDISTNEIEDVCKTSKCFRSANAKLKCHLRCINELVDRVKNENIDVSHFNKDCNCSKCGTPHKTMRILDFDDVGRLYGDCPNCGHQEWIMDGGDVIDAYHYFTEGYKTKEMMVVGHTNI